MVTALRLPVKSKSVPVHQRVIRSCHPVHILGADHNDRERLIANQNKSPLVSRGYDSHLVASLRTDPAEQVTARVGVA